MLVVGYGDLSTKLALKARQREGREGGISIVQPLSDARRLKAYALSTIGEGGNQLYLPERWHLQTEVEQQAARVCLVQGNRNLLLRLSCVSS